MLHIFSLFFLVFVSNLGGMEPEIKIQEVAENLFAGLPDEIKVYIFAMISTPEDNTNPEYIAKSKKEVQNLRQVCRNFNEIFKVKPLKCLDSRLYLTKYVGKLNEKEKEKYPNISSLEISIKHNVVPFIAYCLSKNNKPKYWLQVLNMAYHYNQEFIHKFIMNDMSFYTRPEEEQKKCIYGILKNNQPSKLISWLMKNKIETKIASTSPFLNGKPKPIPVLYCKIDAFLEAMKIIQS